MKKFLAILLSVLMLISLLAACSNGTEDDDNNDDDKGNVNNDDKNNDDKNNDDKDNEEPKWTIADATKTVTYHALNGFTALDKFRISGSDSVVAVNYLIFDSPMDKAEDGTIIPLLAKEWEMADDNLTCTFKLRDDVYFHDGTHFTAKDFAFSFDRICEDTENLPDTYANAWRLYIEEMEIVNDYEVIMHFKAVMPEFWDQVSLPTTCIVPKDTYESLGYEKFWDAPIGTGAYEVSEYDAANSDITVTIRDDEHGYFLWDEDESTHTNVGTIHVYQSVEANTRLASLRTGEVDIIDSATSTEIGNLKSEGFVIEEVVPSSCIFLQFNVHEGELMSNQYMREAVSLSIDRELLVESVLDGVGTPVDFICREGQYGYSIYSEDIAYKFDPDAAKELLEENNYDGTPINFVYSSGSSTTNEMCVAVASMCQDGGLEVELNGMEGSMYSLARTNAEHDMAWASIGSGTNHWYKLVNNGIGLDRFNSGHTDAKLLEAAYDTGLTVNPEELEELYATVYEIMMTEFNPFIVLYWPQRYDAHTEEVTGILYHNYTSLDIAQLWVED